MTTAFEPVTLGRLQLRNRIAMAPMTRSRAYGPGHSPTELMAEYYAQRASAGLIITEGTQPSVIGQGYPSTPGLHSDEQVIAWRTVTDAVHREGGTIFAQLMHAGRIGHPTLLDEPATPVSASAVAADGIVYTPTGPQPLVTPQPLTVEGIEQTIVDFANAARNAIEAGFDGVELHGANGYLLHQFLSTNANQRDDQYGGSPQGRIRFVVEVVNAVVAAIGADRVGLRISPANPFNDIVETEVEETYVALVEAINPLGLAYLHVGEGPATDLTPRLRELWTGTLILNPFTPDGYTDVAALQLIEQGKADIVSYAALFISNPDLPARLALGGPFNAPDYSLAYGGDEKGYTDYPTLAA